MISYMLFAIGRETNTLIRHMEKYTKTARERLDDIAAETLRPKGTHFPDNSTQSLPGISLLTNLSQSMKIML